MNFLQITLESQHSISEVTIYIFTIGYSKARIVIRWQSGFDFHWGLDVFSFLKNLQPDMQPHPATYSNMYSG